jgi:hypothetical protein
MSTPYFPDIAGLGWDEDREQLWEGLEVETSVSQLEARMQTQSYPRWQWTLKYDYLKMISPFLGVQTLAGFNAQTAGGLFSFFYRDLEDNGVLGQLVATSDGATTAYPLYRTWGGYDQPIDGVDKRGSTTYTTPPPPYEPPPAAPYTKPNAITPQAYDNGSPVSATFSAETGLMTLGAAPTIGHVITADFSYVWRCRFVNTSLDFKRQWYQVFEMDGLKIIQCRN